VPANQITVLLVEDEPVARAATRRILEGDGFAIVAEVTDYDEALEAARAARPQLCLVDIGIPGGGGIRLARELSRNDGETVVVMLTASEDYDDLIDSVRAGAAGYLLKSMDPERLTAALRGVLAGEAAIPRSLMAHLVSELRTQGRRRVVVGKKGRAELTGREWEVLELMCGGLTGPEIARRLGLSPVTVRRHTGEIVRKLGVEDRGAAIALAERELDR
jgi:DNA-binding NarL/FixJ family response regulator